jgi:thiol-disulfide isomerase/thioredoxin
LRGWINGSLDNQKAEGKILVIDFWATWCGPCLNAIPHNNEVAKKYADKGVVVVGVCTGSGQDKFLSVAKERGIKYPAARDPGSLSARAWGVRFYPTYAIVDRTVKVRAIGLTPADIGKVLDHMIEGQADSKNVGEAVDKPPDAEM